MWGPNRTLALVDERWGPHLLLLEAVSMFRASPVFVSARGTIQPCYPWYHTVTAYFLPNFPGHSPTHISTHVSMFQGSLTTGPSLILAPQVDGTTKEPAVTEEGLFAITVLKVSALGGTSWTGVVDEGRESSLGYTV